MTYLFQKVINRSLFLTNKPLNSSDYIRFCQKVIQQLSTIQKGTQNKSVYKNSVCDDKPTVDNSLPAKHLTENSSPDNSLLSGFSLQYVCENNFRQNTNITTCRDDGKWTPTVQCYRGSSKQILISLKLFSVDIRCCFDKVRNLFLSVIVLFQSEYIHIYFESYFEKFAVIY